MRKSIAGLTLFFFFMSGGVGTSANADEFALPKLFEFREWPHPVPKTDPIPNYPTNDPDIVHKELLHEFLPSEPAKELVPARSQPVSDVLFKIEQENRADALEKLREMGADCGKQASGVPQIEQFANRTGLSSSGAVPDLLAEVAVDDVWQSVKDVGLLNKTNGRTTIALATEIKTPDGTRLWISFGPHQGACGRNGVDLIVVAPKPIDVRESLTVATLKDLSHDALRSLQNMAHGRWAGVDIARFDSEPCDAEIGTSIFAEGSRRQIRSTYKKLSRHAQAVESHWCSPAALGHSRSLSVGATVADHRNT